jgi:LPXTG-motif cell wall-anchored protein
MDHQVTSVRRALVGLAAMAVGAVGIVVGLTTPASAHESSVEPEPVEGGLSCLELAELFDIDQDWDEFIIEDVADGDHTETHTLSDRGTPDDAADDATVTVSVTNGKTFEWESTVGIDAIYVQGRDDGMTENSYFYLYEEEAFEDIDHGTPPWHKWDKNRIKSISFCWDDEDQSTPPTTAPPTTAPPTTEEPTTTAPPTTEEPSTTSSSIDVTTTMAPTTSPPTVPVSEEELPQTGSNTGMLVAIGAGLLIAGAVLVFSTRQFWRRYT